MSRSRAQRTLRAIAANVRTMRKRANKTQAGLAESAELDLRFIQRVERAERDFGVVALVQIAAALDVTLDALIQPAELPPPRRGRPRGAASVRRRTV